MFFRKNSFVKKGSIIVNTLLIGSVCLVISLYLFKLELEQYKNARSTSRYVTKENLSQESSEYLLSDLYIYINNKAKEKKIQVSIENVKMILNESTSEYKVWHKDAFIIYNSTYDCFIISSYLNEAQHKEDFYGYTVSEGKIKFIYQNTKCVIGKVKKTQNGK